MNLQHVDDRVWVRNISIFIFHFYVYIWKIVIEIINADKNLFYNDKNTLKVLPTSVILYEKDTEFVINFFF